MLMSRLADLIHEMRSRYCSRVYSRFMAFSTRVRSALYRQMNMIAQRRDGLDGLDDVFAEVARVRGGKAHAADAGNFADSGQQFRKGLLPCRIAVGVHVLAQQLNLGVAQSRPSAGLRPAPSRTSGCALCRA